MFNEAYWSLHEALMGQGLAGAQLVIQEIDHHYYDRAASTNSNCATKSDPKPPLELRNKFSD